MKDYDDLLDEAKEELPDIHKEEKRFRIPRIKGKYEGNKTIVKNFKNIADRLGRDPDHVLKYIQKELATPGEFRNKEVIFNSKVRKRKINNKLKEYTKKYVMCDECGKADTTLEKEDDFYIMKCQVCGARQTSGSI